MLLWPSHNQETCSALQLTSVKRAGSTRDCLAGSSRAPLPVALAPPLMRAADHLCWFPAAQVQGADGTPLRSEVSNVESAFTAISGPASLADVVDELADQAVAGELSPRQAAAAIRTATRQHSGGGLAGVPADGGEEEGGAACSPSVAVAEAGTDQLTLEGTEGSDGVSVCGGAARSSVAPSEEGWHQGPGGAGHAGPLHGSGPAGGDSAERLESVPLGQEAPAAAAGVQAAEQEALQEQAPKDVSAAAADNVAGKAALTAARLAPAAEKAPGEEAPADEQPAAAEAEPGAAAAVPVVSRTSSAGYKSQLMQQLTAGSNEEDDITVYSAADVGMAGAATTAALQQAPAAPRPAATPAAADEAAPQALPLSNGSAGSGGFGAGSAAPAAAGSSASPRLEALSVEAGSGAAKAGASGTMSAADTAASLAAINAAAGSVDAASAPTGEQEQQSPQEPQQPAPLLFPPAWYETFKGEHGFGDHSMQRTSGSAAGACACQQASALSTSTPRALPLRRLCPLLVEPPAAHLAHAPPCMAPTPQVCCTWMAWMRWAAPW